MKLPRRGIGGWARELIEECEVSRERRAQEANQMRSYYYAGAASGTPATYNKIFKHIDRLQSYLYSPSDARFALELERTRDDSSRARARVGGQFLSREFHRRDVDIKFGEGVNWALVKGATCLKNIWGRDGFDPYIIQPEMMGVLREDINGLDRQEAFFHSMYLTPGQMRRRLSGHPDEDELVRKIGRGTQRLREGSRDEMFRQIIIGPLQPVATSQPANPAGGIVQWVAGPQAELPPEVARDLIRFDELWVVDDERQDWTTIQLAGDDLVIEGKLQRRNLCGIKEHQPFALICPNQVEGYLWGRSEIAGLALLQDMIVRRMDGIEAILRLQEKTPHVFIGFTGMTDAKYRALMATDGFISEQSPQAKVEPLAPKMPESIFADLDKMVGYFEDMGGVEPILRGEGQAGVRAGTHAETLVRTASPQLRDRALLVERQLEDCGDFAFRLLQEKTEQSFEAGKKDGDDEFLLSQLPDDYRVIVDSHSASPVFSNEYQQLAFALRKAGSISEIDLLRLTHPPYEDTLIAEAERREQQKADFMRQHPELAMKGSRRR
jgi:hypothetical protein